MPELFEENPSAGPSERVDIWLQQLQESFSTGDASQVSQLFEPDGAWRDLVAFTWNIKTAEGTSEIEKLVVDTADHIRPSGWRRSGEASNDGDIDVAIIAFETNVGRGSGVVRIRDGRCATLLTTLQELKGFEERRGIRREIGVEHRAERHRRTPAQEAQERHERLGREDQPYVLIVGGGQNGIALAARLRQLDVPTIVVDKHPRPGDQWRSRYSSLHLHDAIWYNHLPYVPFPDNWPVFLHKDRAGDWLESYTRIMDIDYWSNSECTHAEFDQQSGTWNVEIRRPEGTVTLRPTQLVVALGVSGYPIIPHFEGADRFIGQQMHSSEYKGGAEWAGKRAVVIGSNNSAHDIAADLWEQGAHVTMVQRSSTHIVRSETLFEMGVKPLYSEEALAKGISTETADLFAASLPMRKMAESQKALYAQIAEADRDFYDALQDVGFDIDFGEDGSGLLMKYLRRGSGYYIDVGASQLIIDREISLAHGQVKEISETAVLLQDGTELPADLIVYATGYGSMNEWLASLISPDVADRLGRCWGHGSGTAKDPGPWEGEQRNMWKPTNVDQLWIQGGNLQQARFYSQFLALQLKARMEGFDVRVYDLQPSHHTR